jgi:hypothetical protein
MSKLEQYFGHLLETINWITVIVVTVMFLTLILIVTDSYVALKF